MGKDPVDEIMARAICERVHGGNDPCRDDYAAARLIRDALAKAGYSIVTPPLNAAYDALKATRFYSTGAMSRTKEG